MDEDTAKLIQRVNRIESKGLLDKRLSLDYKPIMHKPSIFFRCLENNSYSFRIHKDGFRDYEESQFWQGIAKREELVFFNGAANRFYEVGFGSLKGYLSTIKENRKLALYLREGVIKDLLTERNLILYQAWLAESADTSSKGDDELKNAKRY